jgi:hypothetical protein
MMTVWVHHTLRRWDSVCKLGMGCRLWKSLYSVHFRTDKIEARCEDGTRRGFKGRLRRDMIGSWIEMESRIRGRWWRMYGSRLPSAAEIPAECSRKCRNVVWVMSLCLTSRQKVHKRNVKEGELSLLYQNKQKSKCWCFSMTGRPIAHTS